VPRDSGTFLGNILLGVEYGLFALGDNKVAVLVSYNSSLTFLDNSVWAINSTPAIGARFEPWDRFRVGLLLGPDVLLRLVPFGQIGTRNVVGDLGLGLLGNVDMLFGRVGVRVQVAHHFLGDLSLTSYSAALLLTF
jgi:hypothetical protein